MTGHRTQLTCGEKAVLVEVGGLDAVLAFAHAVKGAVAAGSVGFTEIVDVVPVGRIPGEIVLIRTIVPRPMIITR